MTTPADTAVRGDAPALPDAQEFARILGQVTWLTTMSEDHKSRPIHWLEKMVVAPIILKQVRIFTKGKQPLAAVLWAYVSDEIAGKIDAGDYTMSLSDWRSGPTVKIVDYIGPPEARASITDLFMQQATDTRKVT